MWLVNTDVPLHQFNYKVINLQSQNVLSSGLLPLLAMFAFSLPVNHRAATAGPEKLIQCLFSSSYRDLLY